MNELKQLEFIQEKLNEAVQKGAFGLQDATNLGLSIANLVAVEKARLKDVEKNKSQGKPTKPTKPTKN